MYPVLFRLGSFEITSFGAMVALGSLAGLFLFRRELRRSDLPEAALDAAVIGLLCGFAGAKILHVILHLGEEPVLAMLLSRSGLAWFGGLIGGVGGALIVMRARRWPVLPILAAATPALALGHAIGRIGCFLVGDDYGRPSEVPWALAFPNGAPPTFDRVHPTQLYECAWLFACAALLWRRRRASPFLFGEYMVLNGVGRFVVEIWRINEPVALGLTEAQWIGIALIVLGCSGWLRLRAQGTAFATT
jgi:phosphatidylglycerol:prolipoprotein diacylglycerol transferase